MQLITVETATLAIGCEFSGPADGDSVILLHGWPDDHFPQGEAPEAVSQATVRFLTSHSK
jgi:hypothetical protein